MLPPLVQQGVAGAPALAATPEFAQQRQEQQQLLQGQQGQQALQAQQPEGAALGQAAVVQSPAAAAAATAAHAPPPFAVEPTAMPAAHNSAWFAAPLAPQAAYEGGYNPQYVEGLEPTPVLPPMGPEEQRQAQPDVPIPGPRREEDPQTAQGAALAPEEGPEPETPDEAEFAEVAYKVFCALSDEKQDYPSVEALDIHLSDGYGVTHPRSGSLLRRMIPAFKLRYNKDREAEHIA